MNDYKKFQITLLYFLPFLWVSYLTIDWVNYGTAEQIVFVLILIFTLGLRYSSIITLKNKKIKELNATDYLALIYSIITMISFFYLFYNFFNRVSIISQT